jgi:hypothetical protein
VPRESARSLRPAVLAVAAFGALCLSVPGSLLLDSDGIFPALRPVDRGVHAQVLDDEGRQLSGPVHLRPGSSTRILVSGFAAAEPILLRRSGSTVTFAGGQADQHGVFSYRFTVPPSMSGAQSLTVIGSLDQSGSPATGHGRHTAVIHFVVSAERAGQR